MLGIELVFYAPVAVLLLVRRHEILERVTLNRFLALFLSGALVVAASVYITAVPERILRRWLAKIPMDRLWPRTAARSQLTRRT